jgi:TonB family protein
MATRNKPYEQFGPYILFKKLESDALGELWRAGRIENGQLGPTVALRRFTGGSREALSNGLLSIAPILPHISGASFVREQHAEVVEGLPVLTWQYAGGRSLRYVIDRARGGKDVQPNPLPIDQAIVIAERVALSLATIADLRDSTGRRLSHGALLPQFIWISDDGEIRVAGQQLGESLVASLSDPRVAAECGRYFSSEYRQAPATANSDVYSMGAILFLLITGQEPPDAATASAFMASVRAGKTMTGAPIPDDIRVILDKSFNLDPSMRYASIGDMKQALSALANSGRYSATTFNLAFYLSTLLKKEMESEGQEREKEAAVAIAPYLEAPKTVAPAAAAAPAAAPAVMAASPLSSPAPRRSKAPLAAAAVLVVAAAGVAGYMMMNKTATTPASATVVTAQTIPSIPKPAPPAIAEPIAVTPATATDTAAAATASMDPEAQKKAFEDAVRAKLQAEMMKLQDDFMEDLKKKQSRDAPITPAPAASAPAVAQAQPQSTQAPSLTPEERATLAAAQLDQQRRQEAAAESARQTAAPQVVQTQTTAPQATAPAPAVAQAATVVREGDVVSYSDVDVPPRIVRAAKPVYPPLAARQKIEATIFLTVLVSETGEVADVRILRGDNRFGLNEAASRAMRSTRFSPATKDGKRVKTWFPQSIVFKAN